MELLITHNPGKDRFEIVLEDLTAFVEYQVVDDRLDILHTIVPKPLEGRGIAAQLVKYTYDYALSEGLKPAATCPYAVVWLHRHPDYTV